MITSVTIPVAAARKPAELPGAPNGSLEQVCTLLAHQPGKLTGNRAARSILAEREPGDRDHDEQDRTDRHDGVKGNRRPSGEGFIIDERLDACP